jgi:nucleoside-diphosphate-sugar epimerase
MRVVVTGGSGKGGRWVVRDLREHGHDVLNVDLRHDGSPHGQCVLADLTDLGQAHDVLAGADAVVHFAAIPAPELRAEGETFRINALSTYNVFAAAVAAGVQRVVWASSETVLGLPFDRPPDFAPIDESITPRPESSYALSKLVGETLAGQFARRSGIGFVGLRISNIMEPDDYAAFPSSWSDPRLRRWNLWGYVDARDVATAARLALEVPINGAEVCIVAAEDTVMTRPSADLMAEVFPGVPLTRPIAGRETLLSIDRARRLLGYSPAHRWADHVAE